MTDIIYNRKFMDGLWLILGLISIYAAYEGFGGGLEYGQNTYINFIERHSYLFNVYHFAFGVSCFLGLIFSRRKKELSVFIFRRLCEIKIFEALLAIMVKPYYNSVVHGIDYTTGMAFQLIVFSLVCLVAIVVRKEVVKLYSAGFYSPTKHAK